MNKKEFTSLRYKSGEQMPTDSLVLGTQQLLVQRFMNPDNNNFVLLVKHDTGTGKTLAVLAAAIQYVKLYRMLQTGKVIIVGFQRETFLTEIFRRPELELLNTYEYKRLADLATKRHTVFGEKDYRNYRNYLIKKLTNPKYGGYIKFYGYQELYNALFPAGEEEKPDEDILEFFKGSLVICDEIHNVYNSVETNSYGRAIKYIRNAVELVHLIYMSATPISNKPDEVIDLLNLIHRGNKFAHKDFFTDKGLKAGALAEIETLMRGYVSFYKNIDVALMPQMRFEGTKFGDIRIIQCDYTSAQAKEIKKLGKVGFDSRGIYDAAVPAKDILVYRQSEFGVLSQFNGETLEIGVGEIGKYSKKYEAFMRVLLDNIPHGKILIYHEYVNTFGIKFIEQLLYSAGILGADESVADSTLCVCGKLRSAKHSGHEFAPVRMLVITGETEKKLVRQYMEMYNASDNASGNRYKIILASKAVREGFDFKAIRQIYALHVLPHISALNQLIGRAVRVKSHHDLPVKERNVVVRIFATPAEVEKYKSKLRRHAIIKEIERVMNASAVDGELFYDAIKQSFGTILPYPRPRGTFGKKITQDTYNIFYGSWEVEEIKKMIRALFTKSPVWEYKDLLGSVRNPPFATSIDFSQVDEKHFILALGDLIYGAYNIIKDGVRHKICYADGYYIAYPVIGHFEVAFGNNYDYISGEPIITSTSWISPPELESHKSIEITDSLLSIHKNYDEMKLNFYKKYKDSTMLEIPLSTEIYNRDFHVRLLEDSITYIFSILTNRTSKSEYHEFYFKMTHFYGKIDLIIYANQLTDTYVQYYKQYTTKESDTNNFLVSSIENTSSISSFDISAIDKFINRGKIRKVPSNILPVGHLLSQKDGAPLAKFYLPSGWFEVPNYTIENVEARENDIIIGYYQNAETTIEFKFKLRKPRHKITQDDDKRKVEKGIFCESKSKGELEEVIKKLNITKVSTTSKDMCLRIKEELLWRELKDRNKYKKGQVPTRTRWCYLQFEQGEL